MSELIAPAFCNPEHCGRREAEVLHDMQKSGAPPEFDPCADMKM